MSLIESLLAEMTIAEKIGQLNMVTAGQLVTGPAGSGDVVENIRAGNVGAVLNLWGRESVAALQKCAVEESRLGIPLFFALDVLHGHRTIFPIPLAEAGAFDPSLWERTARASAEEAAADGVDLTFAPMVDIARDPRWGRIAEGPGEDPFVATRYAAAKVRGFQGARLGDPASVGATAKHFCAGGAAQAGREYAPVDISERTLREVYIPPFEAAIMADCAALMPAFNSVAGVPMTAHVALLRGCVREKLGFQGVIVSDYTAIAELVEHGVAADPVEAAALALKAGVDIDMVSGCYLRLAEAMARGLVDEAQINDAVRRVLTLKQKLGLLDDPYIRCRSVRPPAPSRALAAEAARRSTVLLTNNGVLPLKTGLRRIAVIGPLADAPEQMQGPWSAVGVAENCVSFLDALRVALPESELVCHTGVEIDGSDVSGLEAARALCAGADAVILCLGESAGMSGEAASRAAPSLPGRQRQLGEAALATAVPVVVVLCSGRPLTISWLVERAAAIVLAWFPGDMGGAAVADILVGRFNPTGRLAVTWPRDVGQVPIYFGARSTGRPANSTDPFTSKYLDLPVDPLFHFGHGLSFGGASLSTLQVDQEDSPDISVRVCVNLRNDGLIAVEETVFLFVRDLVARVARPMLELKRWSKVALAPGETKKVTFDLNADDFVYLDERFDAVVENGEFDVSVGRDANIRNLLTRRFWLRCQDPVRIRPRPAPPS